MVAEQESRRAGRQFADVGIAALLGADGRDVVESGVDLVLGEDAFLHLDLAAAAGGRGRRIRSRHRRRARAAASRTVVPTGKRPRLSGRHEEDEGVEASGEELSIPISLYQRIHLSARQPGLAAAAAAARIAGRRCSRGG